MRLILYGTACAIFMFSGCYAKQITVEENAIALDEVKRDQDSLAERIGGLERLAEEQIDLMRTTRAENDQFLGELETSTLAVKELLSDTQTKFDELEASLDRVRKQIAASGSIGAAPGDSGTSSAPAFDPEPLYNAAYLDLVRGNYTAALLGFESYIGAYPDGTNADDALYWMGQCYFEEGEPDKAAAYLERIDVEFPDSERIPPALLRLSNIYISSGRTDAARKALTRLLEEYPDSGEAPLAMEKLKELD